MSLTKNHAVPIPYAKGSSPADLKRIDIHLHDELRKIESALRRLNALMPQAADREPPEKYIGMVRYTDSASWDPTTAGADGWVYWDGASWQNLSGAGGATNLTYTAATRLLASSTGTDVTLPLVSSADAGLAPASGGGTSNFLRADGTWVAPPATDLSYTAATRLLASSTGADVTLPLVSSADAGLAPASGGGTTNYLRADGTWTAPGDVTGQAASIDNEIALFSGTGGKTIKRATTTGLLKATSGVIAAAVSGTDYAPATTGSAILKASAGGFANAVSGTDYAPATSGSSVLKGDGAGGFSAAVDGTDIYSSSRAIPNENIPNGINNASRASQSQVVASGTAYYITRSNLLLPASSKTGGGMVVGTTFRWRVALTKTAAGTGTFQLRIYRGTNGSTADTADVTQTLGTQTAAVDMMVLDVMVVVTTTGGTGGYYWSIIPMTKAATATGFGVATGTTGFFNGDVASVALNTASLQFGLGFISNTGTPTIRIPFCHGQVFNMT
jgi:hypothetical protein